MRPERLLLTIACLGAAYACTPDSFSESEKADAGTTPPTPDASTDASDVSTVDAGHEVLPPPSDAGDRPILLGRTDTFVTDDNEIAGRANVFLSIGNANGEASEMGIYLTKDTNAASFMMGIYSDKEGTTSQLVAITEAKPVTPGGWNVARLTKPFKVVLGQHYWIAMLAPAGLGSKFVFRVNNGGMASAASLSDTLKTLPDAWADGKPYTDGPVSAFAR